jgi:hypothetical protein
MNTPKSTTALGVAGAALLLSLLLVGSVLTLLLTSRYAEAPAPSDTATYLLLGIAAALLLLGLWFLRSGLRSLRDPESLKEPEKSEVLYGRHLVGIGFALLADALLNVVVVAVLIRRISSLQASGHFQRASQHGNDLYGDEFNAANVHGVIEKIAPSEAGEVLMRLFGRDPAECFLVGILLIMSTLVTLLGALFFFATAMWNKMQNADRESFDPSIFWAGLWFRVGEAVVFNLVFFFLLRVYAPDSYLLLPLVSLLVGMFLKSGEQLVSSLAQRLFAAFSALLPVETAPRTAADVYQAVLTQVPQEPDSRAKLFNALTDALVAMRGVESARIDPQFLLLRVRYDAQKLTLKDIRHTVQLLGCDIQKAEPAENQPDADE